MKATFILKNSGSVCIVDGKLFETVSLFKWTDDGKGYAKRNSLYGEINLHRFVMILSGHDCTGMVVDHINRNPLDNRVSNLRICTFAQNLLNKRASYKNKSGFKGVSFSPQRKTPYRASISFNFKRLNLGSFNTSKEAAIAYDKAARKLHGEFAFLNFPNEAA